jgi:hypothetical protein
MGEDGGCFATALMAVRNYGGVLEHPADSHAWRHFGLQAPKRGAGWQQADNLGGWTCCVEQGHYGHFANKRTWLYAAHIDRPELNWTAGEQRLPQEMIDRYGYEKARRIGPMAMIGGKDKTKIRNATPLEFRDVLLGIARSAAKAKRAASVPPVCPGGGTCQRMAGNVAMTHLPHPIKRTNAVSNQPSLLTCMRRPLDGIGGPCQRADGHDGPCAHPRRSASRTEPFPTPREAEAILAMVGQASRIGALTNEQLAAWLIHHSDDLPMGSVECDMMEECADRLFPGILQKIANESCCYQCSTKFGDGPVINMYDVQFCSKECQMEYENEHADGADLMEFGEES